MATLHRSTDPDEDDRTRRLWHLEARFWGAGAEVYREAFAADGVVLVPGALLQRPELLEMMESSRSWGQVTVTEAHVVALGPDVSALCYRASATRDDLEQPYEAMISSIYRHRDGDGDDQLVVHQQSPAPVDDA